MATTYTNEHGLMSIFEPIDCTLYNYMHEQGERISLQGIAQSGMKLADALKYCHMRGYIHGAISSHCVYLTSNGSLKLGGWELAIKENVRKMNVVNLLSYLKINIVIYYLRIYILQIYIVASY